MSNHISTVRQHLLDQMAALRSASGSEAIKQELDRAKGISELAQVAVNTAKVEVDYLIATEQTCTPFLEPEQPETPRLTTVVGEANGIASITRHRLQG